MQSVYTLLFPVGMLIFIFIAFRKHLFKFTGTRHKTRIIYGLAVCCFLTVTLFIQFNADFATIWKSLFVGLVVSLPWIFYEKKSYEKNIVGSILVKRPKQRGLQLAVLFLFIIGLQLFYHSDIGEMVLNAKWPVLSICVAWAIAQTFLLYHVINIEKKIGSPLIEGSKNSSQ